MDTLSRMTPDEFRSWCRQHGFQFYFDYDTHSQNINLTDEELRDFALTVLEIFANR